MFVEATVRADKGGKSLAGPVRELGQLFGSCARRPLLSEERAMS